MSTSDEHCVDLSDHGRLQGFGYESDVRQYTEIQYSISTFYPLKVYQDDMIGQLKTSTTQEEFLYAGREAELRRFAHDDQSRAGPESIYSLQQRREAAVLKLCQKIRLYGNL